MQLWKFVCVVFSLVAVIGCGNTNNETPFPKKVTVVSSKKLSNGSVELGEPRYLLDNTYVKFWAYGEPFDKMHAASFAIHASGICVLVLGPNWVYQSYTPSKKVATGEVGAIVSNIDGKRVELVGKYEFKPADLTPIRFEDGSIYYPKESNFWIKTVVCDYRPVE
jgi:hypothetical protein